MWNICDVSRTKPCSQVSVIFSGLPCTIITHLTVKTVCKLIILHHKRTHINLTASPLLYVWTCVWLAGVGGICPLYPPPPLHPPTPTPKHTRPRKDQPRPLGRVCIQAFPKRNLYLAPLKILLNLALTRRNNEQAQTTGQRYRIIQLLIIANCTKTYSKDVQWKFKDRLRIIQIIAHLVHHPHPVPNSLHEC